MSFELTNLALQCNLKTNLKIVYTTLAQHANKKDYCQKTDTWRVWPSIERLSLFTGLSHSSVRRALKSLSEFGLIQVISRRLKRYRNLSNVYILKRPKDDQLLQVETGAEEITPAGLHKSKADEVPVTVTGTHGGEGVTEKKEGVSVTPKQVTITSNISLSGQHFEPELPPDGVEPSVWSDYLDLLRRLSRPLPDTIQHREQGRFLAQYCSSTQQKILHQSIRNGWQSLHPVKAKNNIHVFKPKPAPSHKQYSSIKTKDRAVWEQLTDRSWAADYLTPATAKVAEDYLSGESL